MFVGHFGVAFAGKPAAPRASLGTLFLAARLVVELALFGGGVLLYLRTTRAADRTGSVALWGLVAFLLLVYAANLFGSVPPNAGAIAWAGHAQWLLVAWAYWVDRHRVVAAAPQTAAAAA